MKNKKQVLLAIIVAVVVLGALSVGIYYYIEENTIVKVQERVQKVCTLKDISRVEFKKNDLVVIEKEAGSWHNPEFTYLEYDNELVSEWLQILQTAETVKIVKNVEDESVYGINEQSTMITVYDNMNNSETLRIGNASMDEDSVYIKNDKDEVIYIVSYEVGQKLLTKPNTFVKYDNKLTIETINKLQLNYQNEEPMNIEFKNDWYLNDYYKIPCKLKEDAINALIESVSQLKLTGYIGTYEDLASFGLEEPRLELIINDETTLFFGNISDDRVYIKIGEAKDVYTIDKAVYIQIEAFKPFDAIERQLTHLNLDEIDKVVLSNPQGTYEFVLAENKNAGGIENDTEISADEIKTGVEEKPADNKEKQIDTENNQAGGADDMETFAWLNEKPLTKQDAQEWLDKIQESLHIEALLQNPQIEQKEERKAEATIEYSLKDGSSVQIELIPYDINYYILRYNGNVQFAVNKDKITKLFMQLNHFAKAK